MAKKIKTVRSTDGYDYPITSYELVVDENGESVKDKLAKIQVSGGGLSDAAASLLISILRSGVYTSDQSSNITALQEALGVTGGGENPPSGGGENPPSGSELPTDGLISEFDFRNAVFEEYNLTNWGTVYKMNDKTNTHITFTGTSGKTGDATGITGVALREIRDLNNEGTAMKLGTSWSVSLLVKGAQPNVMGFSQIAVATNKYTFQPTYINTSGSETALSKTSYDFTTTDYMVETVVVDGSTLKFYLNQTLVATYDGSTYSDFSRWKDSPAIVNTIYSNGYMVGTAIYNRALTEIEIVDICDYFTTLEVK